MGGALLDLRAWQVAAMKISVKAKDSGNQIWRSHVQEFRADAHLEWINGEIKSCDILYLK
jgi:hypothetical protein